MSRPSSLRRRAFTLMQLLVILAVLLLFLGVLFGFLGRVQVARARMESTNNLKHLALGIINAADTNAGKLPPGPENWYPAANLGPNNGYGPCLFHILPFLEENNLYQASTQKLGDTAVFASWIAAGKPVKIYIAPGDPSAAKTADRTSYLANELALPATPAHFPASFPDGTSNTILFAEGYSVAMDVVAWQGKTHTWKTERRWWDNPTWKPVPSDLVFQIAPPTRSASADLPQGFLSSGMNVGMADGSVHRVSGRTTATTFFSACTPAGGEVLGNDW